MSGNAGAHNYRSCLQVALAAQLSEAGFDSVDRMAIESLTEMATALLNEIGRSGKGYCELACRAQPMGADVVLALTEMGLMKGMDGSRGPNAGIKGLREYAMRAGRKSLGTPQSAVASKPASMLHTGDRRKDGRGKAGAAVIPDFLPEFPDSHSYIRTPTHRQPEHDYESVREKAATQKRDVERALTRFMAKTCGRTHSLFNTDDTNLYPLISCDPRAARSQSTLAQATQMFHSGGMAPSQQADGSDGSGADGVVPLPAYVTALMFRDQLFEEDESEYLPKKKTEEEEKAEKGDDSDQSDNEVESKKAEDDKAKGDFDDDSDNEESVTAKKKVKTEQAASSSEVPKPASKSALDNPFLRTTRTPRNVLPGAQMPQHRRL